MNGKTATLLRRYATHSDRKLKELKREWNDMNDHERSQARISMKSELGLTAPAE